MGIRRVVLFSAFLLYIYIVVHCCCYCWIHSGRDDFGSDSTYPVGYNSVGNGRDVFILSESLPSIIFIVSYRIGVVVVVGFGL